MRQGPLDGAGRGSGVRAPRLPACGQRHVRASRVLRLSREKPEVGRDPGGDIDQRGLPAFAGRPTDAGGRRAPRPNRNPGWRRARESHSRRGADLQQGPSQFVQGVAPVFLEPAAKAAASGTWTATNTSTSAGLAQHSRPRLCRGERSRPRNREDNSFSLPHPLEVKSPNGWSV